MNGKISLSIIIAFSITFSSLFTLNYLFPLPTEEDHSFYAREFDPEKKSIYIFGSSHIGRLNTTLVNDNVSQKHHDFSVYNLAIGSDKPTKRIKSLEKIISLKPEIVFYSVSYRDFYLPEINEQPTYLHQLFDEINPKESLGLDSFNPRLMLFSIIKNLSDQVQLFGVIEDSSLKENTPFFAGQKFHFTIASDEELWRQVSQYQLEKFSIGSPTSNEEVQTFKQIIKNLQENNISVVIFTVPLHRSFIDSFPENEKENFISSLEGVSDELKVKIYDFTYKYADMPIWSDTDHVAYNEKSNIFSDDVSKMIISEIES